MTAASARRLSLGTAARRLLPGRSLEDWSPLNGCALWIVELAGEARLDDDDAAAALERLVDLPCPIVGRIGPGPDSRLAREFARRCDALAENDAEADGLRAGAEASPLAASALVHLLRHGQTRSLEAGLVAESTLYSTLQAGPEFRRWLESSAEKRRPSARDESPTLRIQRTGSVLEIELDRPERHNAYSVQVRDALTEALELAGCDPGVEQVVLRGRGASFCSGGDLSEFGALPDPATAHAVRITRSPARLLARLAKRTWAQVHGACIGAGIELVAFADRITAREGAFFQLPELSMGLVPGAGGTASLPRRIGRQRTGWRALTGQRIDTERALAWGLVDEVVGANERFA